MANNSATVWQENSRLRKEQGDDDQFVDILVWASMAPDRI